MSELNSDSITFGKYKNHTLTDVLKDRTYCKWLLEQEWFQNNYEYLYNRVKEFDPKVYFLKVYEGESSDFLENYQFFNLTQLEEIKLELTDNEKKCYEYYLRLVRELKEKINSRIEEGLPNPFDIKAPTKWLQKFEEDTGMKRDEFKTFLSSYELPNLPYIIERIKKEGGIEYKGARSFNIAKERSEAQEAYWEAILKERYGEDIGTQFKYENCIFDFINISTNTIFECKLGMKDFNEEQHKKYLLTLDKYRIIYLIGYDCVIQIERKVIYTKDRDKYILYKYQIPLMKNISEFDKLILDFEVVEVEDLSSLFNPKVKE